MAAQRFENVSEKINGDRGEMAGSYLSDLVFTGSGILAGDNDIVRPGLTAAADTINNYDSI